MKNCLNFEGKREPSDEKKNTKKTNIRQKNIFVWQKRSGKDKLARI